MARDRSTFRCDSCGAVHPKWVGRCAGCGAWNTLTEEVVRAAAGGRRARGIGDLDPVPIAAAGTHSGEPEATGVAEVDRVLGGGLVPGSVTLVGGEPGVGKSTLLLQVLAAVAAGGRRALLVTAEESAAQVRRRAERLGALGEHLLLAAGTDVDAALAAIEDTAPAVVVIDSIQTVAAADVESLPGSVTQVRECAARLVAAAKSSGVAVVLVGHVTKDGSLAGPRVLEHLVDTVLEFRGERDHSLRLLRASKHRFGTTAEIGVFEMTAGGLAEVADPSQHFLADRQPGVPGSIVVPTLDGGRPVLVEVQALVAPSSLAMPRRTGQGVESGRLAMVLAVLDRRAGQTVTGSDVWVSVTGGARVGEPAADLGIAVAVASAAAGVTVPEGLVACGEVGLGGEVRQVNQPERRLAEAARLGFTAAIVPARTGALEVGLRLHRVTTVVEALEVALATSLSSQEGGSRLARQP